MNQEVAKKWVEALRSGEYKQGRSKLRCDGVEYCCLGVLCDLSGLGEWQGDKYVVEGVGSSFLLPLPLETQLRVDTDKCGKYAMMNDGGKSFRQIASQIEKDTGLTAKNSASNTSENPSVSLGGKKE